MAKICAVCGKKPSFGHNRSHSMVATKRRFNPNRQRVRMMLNGKATRYFSDGRTIVQTYKDGRFESETKK